jgi:hypothetical protein
MHSGTRSKGGWGFRISISDDQVAPFSARMNRETGVSILYLSHNRWDVAKTSEARAHVFSK